MPLAPSSVTCLTIFASIRMYMYVRVTRLFHLDIVTQTVTRKKESDNAKEEREREREIGRHISNIISDWVHRVITAAAAAAVDDCLMTFSRNKFTSSMATTDQSGRQRLYWMTAACKGVCIPFCCHSSFDRQKREKEDP